MAGRRQRTGEASALRPVLAVLALLTLAGCGFHPLYGAPDGASQGLQVPQMAQIAISPIPDRPGQILRTELRDRLTPQGAPAKARYRLDVGLKETRANLVILQDATATFAKYVVDANWTLVDVETNEVVTKGRNRRTASFSIAQSQFAILQAESDAQRRAVTELAEDIRLRLGLFFQQAKS